MPLTLTDGSGDTGAELVNLGSCELCTGNVGIAYCSTCSKTVCQACYVAHVNIPQLADHKINKLDDMIEKNRLRLEDLLYQLNEKERQLHGTQAKQLNSFTAALRSTREELTGAMNNTKELLVNHYEQADELFTAHVTAVMQNSKSTYAMLLADVAQKTVEVQALLQEKFSKQEQNIDFLCTQVKSFLDKTQTPNFGLEFCAVNSLTYKRAWVSGEAIRIAPIADYQQEPHEGISLHKIADMRTWAYDQRACFNVKTNGDLYWKIENQNCATVNDDGDLCVLVHNVVTHLKGNLSYYSTPENIVEYQKSKLITISRSSHTMSVKDVSQLPSKSISGFAALKDKIIVLSEKTAYFLLANGDFSALISQETAAIFTGQNLFLLKDSQDTSTKVEVHRLAKDQLKTVHKQTLTFAGSNNRPRLENMAVSQIYQNRFYMFDKRQASNVPFVISGFQFDSEDCVEKIRLDAVAVITASKDARMSYYFCTACGGVCQELMITCSFCDTPLSVPSKKDVFQDNEVVICLQCDMKSSIVPLCQHCEIRMDKKLTLKEQLLSNLQTTGRYFCKNCKAENDDQILGMKWKKCNHNLQTKPELGKRVSCSNSYCSSSYQGGSLDTYFNFCCPICSVVVEKETKVKAKCVSSLQYLRNSDLLVCLESFPGVFVRDVHKTWRFYPALSTNFKLCTVLYAFVGSRDEILVVTVNIKDKVQNPVLYKYLHNDITSG